MFICHKVSRIEHENSQVNNIWKLGLLEASLAQCLLLQSHKIRAQQEKKQYFILAEMKLQVRKEQYRLVTAGNNHFLY